MGGIHQVVAGGDEKIFLEKRRSVVRRAGQGAVAVDARGTLEADKEP